MMKVERGKRTVCELCDYQNITHKMKTNGATSLYYVLWWLVLSSKAGLTIAAEHQWSWWTLDSGLCDGVGHHTGVVAHI